MIGIGYQIVPFHAALVARGEVAAGQFKRIGEIINHNFPESWIDRHLIGHRGPESSLVPYVLQSTDPFDLEIVYRSAAARIIDPLQAQARDVRNVVAHGIEAHSSGFNRLLVFLSLKASADKVRAFGLLRAITPLISCICLLENEETGTAEGAGLKLSKKELAVLKHIATGDRDRDVATKLFISERTVKFHLQNAYRKLGATNRTHAIAKALSEGLLQ